MENVFCVTLLLIPAGVFGWMPPVKVPGTDSCGEPAMCIDEQGYVHVTFYKIVGGQWDRQIFYSRYDGSSWSGILNIDNVGELACHCKITTDTLDRLHIVWTDFGGDIGKLYYTCYNGTTWATPTYMPDTLAYTFYAGQSDIVFDSLNRLHLVWSSGASGDMEIYHSIFDGNIWSPPVNVSNDPQHL